MPAALSSSSSNSLFFPGDDAVHISKLAARGKAPGKLLPDSMCHSEITRGEKLNQLGQETRPASSLQIPMPNQAIGMNRAGAGRSGCRGLLKRQLRCHSEPFVKLKTGPRNGGQGGFLDKLSDCYWEAEIFSTT